MTRPEIPIAHDRLGSGPPLVLVHGIGHRRQAWNPVLPLLADQFDVICIDLPGFGESPGLPPDQAYDVGTTVGHLTAFFTRLGLERPHIAGNSLGGAIALELAARDRVRTATALSPGGFWTRGQRRYALSMLTLLRYVAGMPDGPLGVVARNRRLRAWSGALIFAHPERISPEDFVADAHAMHRGTAFRPTARGAGRYDCLAQPVVPTTVAWGTKDRILFPREARVARDRLPQATFVELTGCGHVPMVDDPERVAAVITAGCRA